jgi:Tol biopolymer transport system component
MVIGILSGVSFFIVGGSKFLGVSAQTDPVEKQVEQNFLNGRIAFHRGRYGMSTSERVIETSNADGGGGGQTSTGSLTNPQLTGWSADGTKIVFLLGGEIYVVDSAGGTPTNLTNTAAVTEGRASWSATGKIAYGRTNQIWTMNTDGTGQAQFTSITRPSPGLPAWSPDGARLAFYSSDQIWVINANGSNEQQVVASGAAPDFPASWSPDGTKIVFQKSPGGISVINIDGTGETPLTTNLPDGAPSWSPDGTKIAFRGTRGLWTMDANGENPFRFRTDNIQFQLPVATRSTTHRFGSRSLNRQARSRSAGLSSTRLFRWLVSRSI